MLTVVVVLSIDCLLGRNSWVEEALSHQRIAPDMELHVVQRLYDAHPAYTPTRTLLHAFASPIASSHHIARWQTETAAVIDRDVACVGATMLWSSALPRLSKGLAEEVAASLSDDVTASSMLHDWLATRNNAVCLHQNALGDLYAQQWWWDANGDHPSTGTATATQSTDAAAAGSAATTATAPSTGRKAKRPRSSLAQPGTTSQQENDQSLQAPQQSWSVVTASQRRSLVQWHGAVGTRGRSVRAMHFLYQALLQSRKLQPLEDTLSQLARWNPVLCRQLLALHRFLSPSEAQAGPTAMHAKLHPALRMPILLPPPRDNAAYRFAAPVAYYRTAQREDARQGQDVFLVDLRGIHLHRAPPLLRSSASTGSAPTRGPRAERNEMQRRLQRWKQTTTAMAVTATLRLSLYELWAQLVSPAMDTTTGAASPAVDSLPALYDLLRLSVEAGELQWTWETLRYAMSTAEVYGRFSDGLYVTGVRVSRRDRIARYATLQQQQAATKATTRGGMDDDTLRDGRKRPRRRRDAPTGTTTAHDGDGDGRDASLPPQPMCDCYWRRVSRWPTETSTAATPVSFADVWCGRRDCVTPHHLIVVVPQSFFTAATAAAGTAASASPTTATADDHSDNDDDDRVRAAAGASTTIATPAAVTSTTATTTTASAGGFDLRSLIFSSSQTPAAPPAATAAASASAAMPSLKSLIQANAPTATPAPPPPPPPPSAMANANSQRSVKPSQTVTFAPLTPFTASVQSPSFLPSTQASSSSVGPGTPLSMPWQQSDVTDDVVEDLLGRWDTQQRGAINSLRQRLTPKLATSRSSLRDHRSDDLHHHRHEDGNDRDHRENDDGDDENDRNNDNHNDGDEDEDDDDENAEEALRRQAQFSRSYFSLMLDDDDDD